jgi:two-component system, NtrC family, nitrogen regulation sensor histidine kinase NtrY
LKSFWKDTIYNNAYFLIGAAWLFTLSFIFSNYWSYTSSPQGVKKNLENYLEKKEKNFFSLLSDSALVARLVNGAASEKQITYITAREYGIFIYKMDAY